MSKRVLRLLRDEGKEAQVCVARVSGVLTRLYVGLSRFYLVTGICQTLVRLTGCMSLAAGPFLPFTSPPPSSLHHPLEASPPRGPSAAAPAAAAFTAELASPCQAGARARDFQTLTSIDCVILAPTRQQCLLLCAFFLQRILIQ